jgi:hypothetical protein
MADVSSGGTGSKEGRGCFWDYPKVHSLINQLKKSRHFGVFLGFLFSWTEDVPQLKQDIKKSVSQAL